MNTLSNDFFEKIKVSNPLSEKLVGLLQQSSSSIWSTLPTPLSILSNYYTYLNKILSGEINDDFASIGVEGHGINSWAFFFYAQSSAFVFLSQIGIENVYSQDNSLLEIKGIFEVYKEINKNIQNAKFKNLKTPKEKLVLIIDKFSFPKMIAYAWVNRNTRIKEIKWERNPLAPLEALSSIPS